MNLFFLLILRQLIVDETWPYHFSRKHGLFSVSTRLVKLICELIGYYVPVSEISSWLTRVKIALSPLGDRAQQLAPFFFRILILCGGHAAFGILAFKRIFFPGYAVSEL